jgi:Lrp/AsnC family leucine-responsive transcriptional regulator
MEAYREFLVTKTTLKHIGSTQSTFMISEVKIQQRLFCNKLC